MPGKTTDVRARAREIAAEYLLTTIHLMGGDVLSPIQTCRVYDERRTDHRVVVFLPERAESGEEFAARCGAMNASIKWVCRCGPFEPEFRQIVYPSVRDGLPLEFF